MIKRKILSLVLAAVLILSLPASSAGAVGPNPYKSFMSQRFFSMKNRHEVPFVNKVMADNMLLNLSYMSGKIQPSDRINPDDLDRPFQFNLVLKPREVFAYHDDVLAKYKDKLAYTGRAHFQKNESFRSDGYLVGDGVCQLASLINWAAQDAGLDVYAPKNHNFAPIPGVPKTYGVSIYFQPGRTTLNSNRNLYITNNKDYPVIMRFEYDGEILRVSFFKDSQSADLASRK